MNSGGAVILGIVQGVTEFIPISSSGHLILVRDLFGFQVANPLTVDVLLHAATLAALLVYFHKDIARLCNTLWRWITNQHTDLSSQRLLGAVVIGTIPAVLAGIFFESFILEMRGALVIVFALIGGSVVFLAAEEVARRMPEQRISTTKGIVIGCFQALALIPGTSRAGITIAGGLFTGLSRVEATRFAFLLGIPAIAGAALKTALEAPLNALSGVHAMGAITAFIVGLAAIHFLLGFLRRYSLFTFAVYRTLIALIVFFFLW
jgi:undecaprenyl-diphosphatase